MECHMEQLKIRSEYQCRILLLHLTNHIQPLIKMLMNNKFKEPENRHLRIELENDFKDTNHLLDQLEIIQNKFIEKRK